METRFDRDDAWYTSYDTTPIEDMGTTHIINILKKMINDPRWVRSMLISDVSEGMEETSPWSPCGGARSFRRESIWNITSMSEEELIDYVKGTKLFNALGHEAYKRGVNTEAMFSIKWAQG